MKLMSWIYLQRVTWNGDKNDGLIKSDDPFAVWCPKQQWDSYGLICEQYHGFMVLRSQRQNDRDRNDVRPHLAHLNHWISAKISEGWSRSETRFNSTLCNWAKHSMHIQFFPGILTKLDSDMSSHTMTRTSLEKPVALRLTFWSLRPALAWCPKSTLSTWCA